MGYQSRVVARVRVFLHSDNRVTLSKVTLPSATAKSAGVTSYVVESNRTRNVKAFATRTDALEYYEEEVQRGRAP
jgi:hypothetical protein